MNYNTPLRVNEELLAYLLSSLQYLPHYSRKYNIPLPEQEKIDVFGFKCLIVTVMAITYFEPRKAVIAGLEDGYLVKFVRFH
jgi:hypothetical protein